MGEFKVEEMSLAALFEQARKIHLTVMESGADQDLVKKGCEVLGKCEDMINKLGLFSSNETKMTSAPPILSTSWCHLSCRADRKDCTGCKDTSSQDFTGEIEEFISFCEAMELVPQEELEASAQSASNSFADRRALKTPKSCRSKADRNKGAEGLKERRGRSTKAAALSTPVEVGEDEQLDDDGEEEREAGLLLSRVAICKAFDLLEMLKKEEMLSAIKEKQLKLVRYTQPAAPITCATFAQDVIEGRANVSQAHDHKHQPMIFGPQSLIGGSLTSERERMAARVFQPAYRMPTMSIEEAGLREMEMMNKWQERNAKMFEEANSAWYKDKPKMGPNEDNEDDDDAQEKARAWDDWKDDNPRGAGNKKLTHVVKSDKVVALIPL
ncbi:PP2A regulatory subunit TAP46 [Hibiscus syriacus]|uniref:PP2A regulatory subunit TAP46 n=1 Tax=Hibiscus syriacus TaxID=106335 RepID=A0A6A3BXL2_HIBSY|nr:PP2A regulatory subunit TAP46 [Hibiscus syriacus]